MRHLAFYKVFFYTFSAFNKEGVSIPITQMRKDSQKRADDSSKFTPAC